ncbi:uncharacterized protein LOC131224304 [Magnolia sinica]|uniref:uncharacterized protein LOC131224304 n=1 Tax=Magnolia sinica TaxID=86752 RepID=UPI002657D508|nr:uncharacterized protein LOC131224304 [Magnolia sinica]
MNISSLFERFQRFCPLTFASTPRPEEAEYWLDRISKMLKPLYCTEYVPYLFLRFTCYDLGYVRLDWNYDMEILLAITAVLQSRQPADEVPAQSDLPYASAIFRKFQQYDPPRFSGEPDPESALEQRVIEFEALVQGDMMVSHYKARFVALSRFTPYLVDDEKKRAHRFVSDLHPALRSRVVRHYLMTFNQVIHRALVYEEDWALS